MLHEFLLHEFAPLGVLLGTRALAHLAARPLCSTLQTLVRPTARSMPLGKCLSRSSVQLELSRFRGCTWPLGLVISAQTLVCQTARSGPLGRHTFLQAVACGTARSWTTRPCGWQLVGPLGPWSWRLTARRRSSAGPLGLSPLCEQPTCPSDGRQTRTGSDARPLDHSVVLRCFRWLPPFCCPRDTRRRTLSAQPNSRSHPSDPFLPELGVPARMGACLFAPPASHRRTSGPYLPRTAYCVSTRGYLRKARSWATSTLVLPTARSVAARPEHVLVQTALAPTLSQWVPALIHPHVTLGPCTPLGVQSL